MTRFLGAYRQLLVLMALLVCACPLQADPPAHKKWKLVFSGAFSTGRQYWGDYKPLPPRTVRLSEGRHVLQVRFETSPLNFGGLEFRPAAK